MHGEREREGGGGGGGRKKVLLLPVTFTSLSGRWTDEIRLLLKCAGKVEPVFFLLQLYLLFFFSSLRYLHGYAKTSEAQ